MVSSKNQKEQVCQTKKKKISEKQLIYNLTYQEKPLESQTSLNRQHKAILKLDESIISHHSHLHFYSEVLRSKVFYFCKFAVFFISRVD